jgi:hypothetical protein
MYTDRSHFDAFLQKSSQHAVFITLSKYGLVRAQALNFDLGMKGSSNL